MKKPLFTLLIILCSTSLSFAQGKVKVREIGLTTSSFNNFGLTYRIGKNNNSLWRFSALSSSVNNQNSPSSSVDVNDTDFGIGISVGKEKRSVITEKFELRYGVDIGYQYDYGNQERIEIIPINQTTEDILNIHEMSINGVFGFNFLIAEEFVLGGEVLPRVYYRSFKRENLVNGSNRSTVNESDRYGFNLNTSSLRLSFVYRF